MSAVRAVPLAAALLVGVAGSVGAATGPILDSGAKRYEAFDPRRFDRSMVIDHEWWPLEPGTEFVYEGKTLDHNDERVPHRLVVTVTDLTKAIGGVRSAIVFERDYTNDTLVEAELVFLAQDTLGNVWHLGRYRESYEDKAFIGGRAFLVGHLENARAGIMMPAKPAVGSPSYSQGYGPPPYNWTNRARIAAMGQTTQVAVGSYDDVMVIEEYDSEEPGAAQLKYYARGVGNVRMGWKGQDPSQQSLELVRLTHLTPEAMAELRTEALRLEERAYVYGSTPKAEVLPAQE